MNTSDQKPVNDLIIFNNDGDKYSHNAYEVTGIRRSEYITTEHTIHYPMLKKGRTSTP